jgi:hypothetical protein
MSIEGIYKSQFEYARKQGWLPFFKEASLKFNFPVALLMAIASRETNMKNIRGDFRGGQYHGFGPMQVDIGTEPAWIASGAWRDSRQAILKGTEILARKRTQMNTLAGRRTAIGGKPFTVPVVRSEDYLKVLVPMYNSGMWPLYHYSRGEAPDATTTGHNYGADVLQKQAFFTKFLQATSQREFIPEKPAGTTATGAQRPAGASLAPGGTLSTPETATAATSAAETALQPQVNIEGDVKELSVETPVVPGAEAGAPPVAVEAAKPVHTGRIKAMASYITTAIAGLGLTLSSAWGFISNTLATNPRIMGLAVAGLIVFLIAYWKFQDRQTAMDKMRETHAHEINKLQMEMASRPDRYATVLVDSSKDQPPAPGDYRPAADLQASYQPAPPEPSPAINPAG